MNRYVLTIIALALAVAMCITVPVSSEDSDAFDIVSSEAGLRWDSSTLSSEDIARLYTSAEINDMAWNTLETFADYVGSYDFSEVAIYDMTISKSNGTKVTPDAVTFANAESVSYKISFKATCTSLSDNQLFDNYVGSELISYVCFSDTTQNGAVFEVTAEVTEKDAIVEKRHIAKTNSGNYVVTGSDIETTDDTKSVKGTAKYTYNDGTQDVVREFSFDVGTMCGYRTNTKTSFDGKVEDATIDTAVLNFTAPTGTKFTLVREFSFDGKTFRNEYDVSDYIALECRNVDTSMAVVYSDGDLNPPQIYYYSDMGDALFYHVADPSLRSNDAMKAFLQDHGTTSETFSSAQDLAESMIPDTGGSNILFYAGIGIAVAAIAAVGYFLFARRKASA